MGGSLLCNAKTVDRSGAERGEIIPSLTALQQPSDFEQHLMVILYPKGGRLRR